MLDATEIGSTDWQELKPDSPNYYFLHENIELRAEYERSLEDHRDYADQQCRDRHGT